MSSFDIKFNSIVSAMRDHFGDRANVTRQEVLAYEKSTNIKIPQKFWGIARTEARGIVNLRAPELDAEMNISQPTIIHHPVAKNAVVQHAKEAPSVISKFSYDEMVPLVKDTYVEWGNYKTMEKLLKSNNFFTLYVTGDSGSGKNEMISQACAVLKKPLVRISMTRETKEEHLIGSKTLIDGTIVYEEGPVVWAAKNGAVLLLDELSCADANETMCLQNILEGNSFFVKSANQLITPKEGFCIIATDNTKGRGSDSGRYIGTNILNDAFLERFQMTMEQGYPNEKIERKIIEKLMQKIQMDDSVFVDRLVTWVQAIRKTYLEDGLEEQITTRRACHIVNVYKMVSNAKTAIELCTSRFDETTTMAMVSLWDKLTVESEKVEVKPEQDIF